MGLRAIAFVALAACSGGACSGGKAKAVEDARKPPPAPADAAVVIPPAPTGPYRVDTTAKTGDVQIRVEWKDVPQALRASPGATPCGTPSPPPVSPTTTWGIPDAFVAIEVNHGKAHEPPRARIVLDACLLSPRVAITGTTLAIASAVEQPSTVTLAEGTTAPRTIYLPIAGHEVEAAATPGATSTVAAGAETASVVSATTPYTAITEATGQVIVRDVPVGTYGVRAWLPKRGALEARTIAGSVTVTAGALTEVTLDISRP